MTDDRSAGADFDPAPIQLGTPRWQQWLAENDSFVFQSAAGPFTARREPRRGSVYWYAYRRRAGALHKAYLGRPHELTPSRLEQAGAQLAGQGDLLRPASLPVQPIPPTPDDAAQAGAAQTSGDGLTPEGADGDPAFVPMTEITPPALPHPLVARPRLSARMSAPLTVICAPSGYGKSTVLNEWRRSAGMPIAWVSLTPDDNRPLRFWSKVAAALADALQAVEPALGQNWLLHLRASPTPDLSRVLVSLTNDILRLKRGPDSRCEVGLVLDNYHHIRDTEVHTSLQTWLEHLPQTLKLALASNTKPPLALGYLKAKGMVVEFGADDLRFTPEEGREFLRLLRQGLPQQGQRLADHDRQTLVKCTEGWITGLVLADCALGEEENPARFAETFTGAHPLLREYFAESVLRGLPWELHTFLLKTAILRRLTAPLCDAVTGESGSAEMLAAALARNLFIEPAEDRDGYRYHPLFAEALRVRLQEQFPAEALRLHRRAADWHLEHDAPADAIEHLLAGRSWDDAAALIESVALAELAQRGTDARLLRWLRDLPDAVIRQHPALLALYLRLACTASSPAVVEGLLARLATPPHSPQALDSSGAMQEALSQETLAELATVRGVWQGDGPARAWETLDGLVQCHRDYRRDLLGAEARASAVYEAARQRRDLYGILVAGGGCANLALSQGRLKRSEQIATEVLRQAFDLAGKYPEPASIPLIALSNVCFMRNQLTQAQELLQRAAEVNPNPISTNEMVASALLRAKIQSAQGDNAAAFAIIQAVREVHSRRPSAIWFDQDLVGYQELFRLRQGDVAAAERFLDEAADIRANPFCALVRAEILIEQQRYRAAEETLDQLLALHPHGSYLLPVMRGRVILAIALFHQSQVDQARQIMAEAARLAAPEYFIRPFLDYGPRITPLLALVLHTEHLNAGTRAFLKGTLAMLGHSGREPGTGAAETVMELALAASVSPREQEVLRSLSAGLSNREIAAQFCISEGTVKSHLESIYRKLGVSSRTQAVAQAHALKLL